MPMRKSDAVSPSPALSSFGASLAAAPRIAGIASRKMKLSRLGAPQPEEQHRDRERRAGTRDAWNQRDPPARSR